MYEIYLTDITVDGPHPERVADLITVEDRNEAHDFCTTLQPWLRDGVEAHFVAAD